MRTPVFAYAKRKVTAQLISAFVFATQIVQSLCFLSPKFKASIASHTARFVSDMVGDPEDRLSRYAAHSYYHKDHHDQDSLK